MNSRYVQYGCGLSAPKKWRNFDASPSLRIRQIPIIGELYTKRHVHWPSNIEFGNIIDGLPIPDGSCKAVYCSHVLEHLALEDLRLALINTCKLLEPGGCFRVVLPDLEYFANKYIADSSTDAAVVFLKETSLGKEKRSRGLKGFLVEWLGNSRHLWMWDYKSLALELQNAGFADIRRAEHGDAEDEMFSEVEDEGRWNNCLGIEAKKV